MCLYTVLLLLLSCSAVSNSFETPWNVACQAPLSIEFPRQEYWNRLSFPISGTVPNPGIERTSLASPALAAGFFITNATWEAWNAAKQSIIHRS